MWTARDPRNTGTGENPLKNMLNIGTSKDILIILYTINLNWYNMNVWI